MTKALSNVQVLEQLTSNQKDVVCMAALENQDKNRSKLYLPGNDSRLTYKSAMTVLTLF